MTDSVCNICPRHCPVSRRNGERGYCGAGKDITVSHVCRYMGEEPVLTGKKGSGAIFFGGCNMRCAFCQNKDISHVPEGRSYDARTLSDLILKVQERDVQNINLITPTPYAPMIAEALSMVRDRLAVPVVYNTSAYETRETVRMLYGLVDIYLPDIKYFSDESSLRYSNAPMYAQTAFAALEEMLRQLPRLKYDAEGNLLCGVVVRHLCLPSHSADTAKILEKLSTYLGKYELLLSLMSQYTPSFLGEKAKDLPEINRKITTLEFERSVRLMQKLGFEGFIQSRSSATEEYTPRFDARAFREKGEILI